MIERKFKMEKDNVIKDVDENLVSIYFNMGWSKVEETPSIPEKGKKTLSDKFLKGNE